MMINSTEGNEMRNLTGVKKEMYEKTLSYLNGLLADYQEQVKTKEWMQDYVLHVQKQITYLKKHGHLPVER
jgi:hypothetical protein